MPHRHPEVTGDLTDVNELRQVAAHGPRLQALGNTVVRAMRRRPRRRRLTVLVRMRSLHDRVPTPRASSLPSKPQPRSAFRPRFRVIPRRTRVRGVFAVEVPSADSIDCPHAAICPAGDLAAIGVAPTSAWLESADRCPKAELRECPPVNDAPPGRVTWPCRRRAPPAAGSLAGSGREEVALHPGVDLSPTAQIESVRSVDDVGAIPAVRLPPCIWDVHAVASRHAR